MRFGQFGSRVDIDTIRKIARSLKIRADAIDAEPSERNLVVRNRFNGMTADVFAFDSDERIAEKIGKLFDND